MPPNEKIDIPHALYHAPLGKLVVDYIGQIHPTVIEEAMESRSVRTLEAIRQILQDNRYTDPECFEVIDELVIQFFQDLEVRFDRHSELD